MTPLGLRFCCVFAITLIACGDDGGVSADSTGGSGSTGVGTAEDGDASSSSGVDMSTDGGTSATSTGVDTSGEDTSTGLDSSSSAEASSGESSSTGIAPACGDGTQDPDEECDDDNSIDDDGCDADCVPSLVVQIAGDLSEHTCVRTRTGAVRCWGRGSFGRLGYANTNNIGDDEVPADAGSVDVGGIAVQIAAGYEHTCAVLDDGAVRCWGRGANGRLGYGNLDNIGDGEAPASAGDVDVAGVAIQVVTGAQHACALLEGGTVRCWGAASSGQLGYGNAFTIGDDETPASVGDVDVGGAGVVVEIAAGNSHTCARLDTGVVRCWGANESGQLGLGHTTEIGDDELPSSEPDVVVLDVSEDDEVVGIAAAYGSTCVLLASGNARCWGFAGNGECGYGNTESIGDDETPASAGNISLGGTVVEVNAGPCARMDDGAVRCWGLGFTGALGLGDTENIGDDELPSGVGPISIGGPAVHQHSDGIRACAVLDTGELRCWGIGDYGVLGYGDTEWIGDDPGELPDTVGPVQVF